MVPYRRTRSRSSSHHQLGAVSTIVPRTVPRKLFSPLLALPPPSISEDDDDNGDGYGYGDKHYLNSGGDFWNGSIPNDNESHGSLLGFLSLGGKAGIEDGRPRDIPVEVFPIAFQVGLHHSFCR